MNREEKKKYLSRYLELKHRIESLIEENFFWQETAISVPISRLDLSGVHGTGKHKNPVDEHFRVCELIDEKQKEAEVKLKEILAAIDTVPDSQQRTVLIFRYVNGLYFHEIAPRISVSTATVFRLHNRALDSLKVDSQ